MKIAIDFDGTCVYHECPDVGDPVPYAIDSLKTLVDQGHKLILYTMRSGSTLDAAVAWFYDNEIELYSVQMDSDQHQWTTSNKCFADLYIDDRALGCPLLTHFQQNRAYVDWLDVMSLLSFKMSSGGG